MPHIIKQPDDTGLVPRLNDGEASRKMVRAGRNKWDVIQQEIEHVLIGRRKFWTDEALADYVRRQTRKPPTAQATKPRRAARRKAVPAPPKGRRRRAAVEQATP
jgi:hypothetical protein